MSVTSAVPELQSPFAGFAGLEVPAGGEARPPAPPSGPLDSPFGAGAREVPGHDEDLSSELLEQLDDEEFTDAVSQLVDEAAAVHLQGETSWSAGESTQLGLTSWTEAIAQRSDRMLDGLAARLGDEDLATMPARDLDTLLESWTPEPDEVGRVAVDQFLGGLLKKAGNLVKGVVKVAKKGIAAVSKVLPVGALLKKLAGLVRPLLTRVLKAAINRLPETVRPIARQVAKKLGITAGEAASAAEDLAAEFDHRVADLALAPDEATADNLLGEAAAEASAEAGDPVGELDTARQELGRRLTEMPAGAYPKPEIQQFLPAVMAALPIIKLGISIIGRQRVVDFIAERIADLLRAQVGSEPAKQIARPIVDVGMSLIGLEVPPGQETAVAGEALAATVEETARRVLTLPAAIQDDRLALDAAVQQSFAEAAAAHLPGALLRADLPERESEDPAGVWVLMPRAAAPRYRFLRYARPLVVRVSRPVARTVPWSDGGTLETHLLDRGVQHWPAEAEAFLYELLPGGHLGHLRHDDTLRAEGEAGADEVEPLTPELAGLLLGEPGLGRPASRRRTAGRARPAPGRRFVRLRLAKRRARAAAGPRVRVGVRIDTTSTPPRLLVALRLSERQAQEVLALLTRPEGPDLPSALRMLQQVHRKALGPRLAEALLARQLVADAEAGKTAAEALTTVLDTALSGALQSQTTQFTAAVRDAAQGVTVRAEFAGVTAESLQGTPSAPTVTVTPGWGSGG
ncbi:hypothetical protein ACFPK1_15785 [Actinomycetospora rhizophila]|uniref:Uncharacterized protein n=1 Tax=Actinomycetospora rhizophila TaxID=1416876 RepID=A0ABV9ZF10_9PSEU